MQRYIAFLRAVNVGGRTVKMDALREHFVALGFAGVATFIASGNVIFESDLTDEPAIEQQIEDGLREALGFGVETLVRTVEHVAEVAQYNPFPNEDINAPGSSLYVMFLREVLSDGAVDTLEALSTATEAFHVRGREVYWWCRTRISDSPFFSGTAMGRIVKTTTTTRNITTIRKLAGKYGPAA